MDIKQESNIEDYKCEISDFNPTNDEIKNRKTKKCRYLNYKYGCIHKNCISFRNVKNGKNGQHELCNLIQRQLSLLKL